MLRRPPLPAALALILTTTLALLAGCAMHVNIPPQVGDTASHDPNADNVRQVCAAAIMAVYTDEPVAGRFRVRLPVGSEPNSYDAVIGMLGEVSEQAVSPAASTKTPMPSIDARQVRIRGWYAQVDVIRPLSYEDFAGPKQLVTVDLKWGAGGWQMSYIKFWRLDVQDALRQSVKDAEYTIGQ